MAIHGPREPPPACHKMDGNYSMISCRCAVVKPNGDHAVIVEFDDGATRVVRLDQTYWLTPISEMLPAASPKPRRSPKLKPVHEDEVRADDEGRSRIPPG